MRDQARLIELLKRIDYQYIKHLIDNRTDEEKVEHALSVINGQLEGVGIVDAEMPLEIMGVTIDWEEGAVNDEVIRLSFGDFTVIQDLSQPNQNVKIKMPTNISVSFNTLEEQVEISWTKVNSAAGYKIIRDYGLGSQTTILDGSTGYTESAGTITFIDSVGDNISHSYVVMAKGSDPSDSSEYSSEYSGKGYSLFTENIALSGYQSQTVTTSASAMDIQLTGVDIAGGSGGASDYYAGGAGGRGYNFTSPPISNGSHALFFGSGSAGGNPSSGSGYFNGGMGGYTQFSGYASAGGGGASVIKVDNVAICGSGGGAGGGSASILNFSGGSGGGIHSAGVVGVNNATTAGGSGGGGNGINKAPGQAGSAVAAQGSFGSTTTHNGAGYINATLTWKE